jgi:para-aminobenzoate synthetase/4-amino-4-deoxychorismate lyase
LRPGGNLLASVPIRTVVLDRTTGIATFSVGAGITADSTAADEWAECLAKARVVRPPAVPEDAALFETLRLEEGQYVRRDAHVARLLDSARLFGWPAPRARVEAVLDGLAAAYVDGTWRARLQLDRTGVVDAEAVAFVREDPARVRRVALALTPVDTRSPLLFNKTTRREVYDEARAAQPDVDDVLLWNARGELTEGTIANLVVELDGVRVTPPIASGLLPGVFRADLLARGAIEERVVLVSDLPRASRLWLVNSLREWMPVAWDGRV